MNLYFSPYIQFYHARERKIKGVLYYMLYPVLSFEKGIISIIKKMPNIHIFAKISRNKIKIYTNIEHYNKNFFINGDIINNKIYIGRIEKDISKRELKKMLECALYMAEEKEENRNILRKNGILFSHIQALCE